ncbi:hypothetical protein E4U19_005576 [Claviceps sp. Clav32 group G5]|nr:hypothetical protein E4U19_005576 [Claviceps sp. Clav32 group G5]KAG6051419.1 hypothetical protein E4U39_001136 [Claviceps sp. Clav50 group G5]
MTGPSLSQILGPSRPSDAELPLPPSADRPTLLHQESHRGTSSELPSKQSLGLTVAAGSSVSVLSRDTSDIDAESLHAHTPTTTVANTAIASTSTPSVGRNHGSGNLYACRDCGRSYSRPKHLVRHVQTHTLGRRFSCEICQKSFARKDLLRRHVVNHSNDSTNKKRRTNASPAAGRVSHACRPCAVARVKCDDSKPCQRCITRKLSCVTSEVGVPNLHSGHVPANINVPAPDLGASFSGIHGSDSTKIPSPASHGQAHSVHSASTSMADAHTATMKNTPYSESSPHKPEEGQVLTPRTVQDQFQNDALAPIAFESSNGLTYLNNSPFYEFLRDVLYEQPIEPNKAAGSLGMPVLDLCDNANLDLTEADYGVLYNWNLDSVVSEPMPVEQLTYHAENPADMNQMRKDLVKVWTGSPWRWDPKSDDNGYKEQGYCAVPSNETSSAQFQTSRDRLERVTVEKLEQPSRDRVMSILLSQCREPSTANRVASSFPTVDVLDTLIHMFLAAHACQVDSWIHFPTLKLNEQQPDWIAMAAAHGGAMIPISALRKFGMAVMEAVRVAIPARFEENNTAIQNGSLVQALILVQDLGLWSGNRRRMEIAECHLVIPVTMMRYRGKFQRASYPALNVDSADEGDVLQEKWRTWIEREQWKRLVFHCYLREAQASMTTLTNPCLSYAELTLPLPEARELWFANTAEEWKAQYLERTAGHTKRPPSIGDLFHDVHLLTENHARLDTQFSISIFLHGFWALILEYSQLSSVHKSRSYANSLGGDPNLLLSSRHQELVKDLQSFHLIAANWQDMSPREHLLLNLLMMNLHISIDDLQLFLGKEGEDQARRVYPLLQQWITTSEARSSVWCASQVLRYAGLFPPSHLKDFYAVAVHHASITIWTYGVVTRANRRQYVSSQWAVEPVYLDSADSNAIQRFIGLEQGRPLIKGPLVRGRTQEASLHDPHACMSIAEDTLRVNFAQASEGMPSIVENLMRLIKQLGNAAWAVGLG